ncbi:MAG: HD domain-containing protein [DPANN group archaeon]|nr:HD domain-containing protein [DPANN group archaeon]
MERKDLIKLAEEYCLLFHQSQKRKGGNQEPYHTHPFAVRDILVRYGYDDVETQVIALLHDTIEDTKLRTIKSEIEKRFGTVVYDGVYTLSNNTVGKYVKALTPLFDDLGVKFIDANETLTPQAYKLRIMFSRDTIKRIKIADMIHNTSTLSALSKSGIERKLRDSATFYIPLGKAIAPIMVTELITNIINYKQSKHFQTLFG